MLWDGPFIGGGGNSGFQALNLAVRWGAARVVLTGYDYKDPGNHWFGRHPPNFSDPPQSVMSTWIANMNRAAPEVLKRAEVINASRDTALECFPRLPLSEALP